MLTRRSSGMIPALLVGAALAGCAGNTPEIQSLSSGAPTEPPSPSAGAVSASPAGNGEPAGVPVSGAVGSATDIYAHIARGAMACWFAVNGPLKKNYIFHAAAEAPSRGGGGQAVITIHERDPSQANPRGVKAYVVEIQPTGEASANVRVDNRKMSDAYAAAMTDDISRWAKGEEGCTGPSTPVAWAPKSLEAVAEAPTKKSKKAKPKASPAKAAPKPSSEP